MEPISSLGQMLEKHGAAKKSLPLESVDEEQAYDQTPNPKMRDAMRHLHTTRNHGDISHETKTVDEEFLALN